MDIPNIQINRPSHQVAAAAMTYQESRPPLATEEHDGVGGNNRGGMPNWASVGDISRNVHVV
jgi:hypothetical protein